MDQCKIVPMIDQIKGELTSDSAFFFPVHMEGEDYLRKYLAIKIDPETFKLNNEIISLDVNRENLSIEDNKFKIASFFEYSINENTGIPVCIYEKDPSIDRSMSFS